ncbi:MAG: hypothetical protein Q7T45_15025, partial [Bradyrhizobium sp.]|uniref:hypothetical protein n=1 Tax=Bradyrhizobium sp. TaxID=376 RepID=UPI002720BFF9
MDTVMSRLIRAGATALIVPMAIGLAFLAEAPVLAQSNSAPDGIRADMFPVPASDLPAGWWWAKDAGAVDAPPQKVRESWTPSWRQSFYISRTKGYVFKPYGSGLGGSWCRPEKNGPCDLPRLDIDINITDFSMHGGAKPCLASVKGMFESAPLEKRWLSQTSWVSHKGDPDQFVLQACFGQFYVTVLVVGRGDARFGQPEEKANLEVARFYAGVVGRRIGETQTIEQGVPGSDSSSLDTPIATAPPTDTAATDGSETGTGANELTPAEIAAVLVIAGGAALLGSLTMLGATGVRREEALQAIRDLLRGRMPEDPFEAWKRKYEALGWKYSEKGGVATFDPVDGARNEGGEIYSAERGGFVRPTDETPAPPPLPRDGDVNARGEVWSDYSHGFVGRNTYEQDKANQAWLADKAKSDLTDMQQPDED